MKEAGYEVLWPRGKKTHSATNLARRLENLQGKRVGELWNWSFRGDQMFPTIEQELTKRYPGIKFVGYEELGSIGMGNAETLGIVADKLKQNQYDAVICGVGC